MVIRWLTISVVVVLLLGLMLGCGISQEQYDALSSELNKAKNELQCTKAELESTQSKVSELTSSLETSQNELQSTQAELSSVQSEVSSTKEKLVEIEKVYPPRQFSSSIELKEWLKTNDKSEKPFRVGVEGIYSLALELQEDALNDGYIISVDVDPAERQDDWYVVCVAVINGELWAWSPESDEITEVSAILGWEKIP